MISLEQFTRATEFEITCRFYNPYYKPYHFVNGCLPTIPSQVHVIKIVRYLDQKVYEYSFQPHHYAILRNIIFDLG